MFSTRNPIGSGSRFSQYLRPLVWREVSRPVPLFSRGIVPKISRCYIAIQPQRTKQKTTPENRLASHRPSSPRPLLTTNARASSTKPLPPSPNAAFCINAAMTSHCRPADGRLSADALACTTPQTSQQKHCREQARRAIFTYTLDGK